MKKLSLILAAALLPATAVLAEPATPVVGKMLYSTGGKKLAAIYKLDAANAPQILLDGKLVTVPAATLNGVDGRIETSLTKKDLMTLR